MDIENYTRWVLTVLGGAILGLFTLLAAVSKCTGYTFRDWIEYRQKRKAVKPEAPVVIPLPPPPPDYNEDTFRGLLWRWSWASDGSGGWRPYEALPHCPKCQSKVRYGPSPEHRYGAATRIECPTVKCRESFELTGSPERLFEDVYLMIDRNWRTGRRGDGANGGAAPAAG